MLNNLNRNELHYYLLLANLDRYDGGCNTVEHQIFTVCVPKKIGNTKLKVFNMIPGINASKTLMKHILCDCRYKFDSSRCNSNKKWNNDKC